MTAEAVAGRVPRDPAAEAETLRVQLASLRQERERLSAELGGLRDELTRHRSVATRLQDQLDAIARENEALMQRQAEIDEQQNSMANLYVASFSLHASVDREAVLAGIQEIVANLIGCEEMALFQRSDTGLAVTTFVGLDPAPLQAVDPARGVLGQCLRGGSTWVRGRDEAPAAPEPWEAGLTACVPLLVDGNATGALALFRLLPQKCGTFSSLDHEMFDFLASRAGIALLCADLCRRSA